MPIPPEIQTLLTLTDRKVQLQQRRLTLQADEVALDNDLQALFLSGVLGVSEGNKYRVVHLRSAGGRVRLLVIIWTGQVNGVNTAETQIVEVDEQRNGA